MAGTIFTPEAYGATRDGSTNDSTAFAAAITAMATGDILQLRAGTYKLNSTLTISKAISIIGVPTPWYGTSPSCRLYFASGIVGLDVQYGFFLQEVHLQAVSASGSTNHGIKTRAALKVEDCRVQGFGGNGIDIDTSSSGESKHWEVLGTRIMSCTGHGIYTKGANSVFGIADHVHASDNDGWGFYEESELGNAYISCRASTNATGGFKLPTTATSNKSGIFAFYSEGAPACEVAAPAFCIPMRGSWTGGGLALSCLLGTDGFLPSTFTHDNVATAGNQLEARIGGVTDSFLEFSSEASGSDLYRLQYDLTGTGNKWYVFRINNDNGLRSLAFSSGESVDGHGTCGVGQVHFPNGLFFGSGLAKIDQDNRSNNSITRRCVTIRETGASSPATRAICWASSQPASGGANDAWNTGDIVFNSTPSAGTSTPIGWVCTSGGTPGSWSPLPNL